MPSEVLIKGRDAAFFAERLAPEFLGVRFHAAHDPAEALAKCAMADILIIRTDEIFAELIDKMPKLAFIFLLHFVRDIRDLFATQAAHRWNRVEQRLLDGQTAVIVGVGAIAEELAKRCKVFGMKIVGVSNGRSEAPHFDAILPRAR